MRENIAPVPDQQVGLARHRRMDRVLGEKKAEHRIRSVRGNAADQIGRIEILDIDLEILLLELFLHLLTDEDTDVVVQQVSGFVYLPLALHKLLTGALGNDDHGMMTAFQAVVQDREEGIRFPFQSKLDFGNKTVVDMRIGKRGIRRDESAVGSHHMNQPSSVPSAFGFVVRHGNHRIRGIDGGLETECLVDIADVVVDRFGNADDADVQVTLQSRHRKVMRCTERAVAADAEQHVDIHPHQCFQHQIRILLPAGGTENRPALLVNAVHRQFIKDDRTITEIGIQSGIPVRYSIYDRHAINLSIL